MILWVYWASFLGAKQEKSKYECFSAVLRSKSLSDRVPPENDKRHHADKAAEGLGRGEPPLVPALAIGGWGGQGISWNVLRIIL